MNSLNKNVRFIIIFSVILGGLVFFLGKSGSNQNKNLDELTKQNITQPQLWAEGNYQKVSQLNLDVEAINKALIESESPSDFEEKVNAIYQGSETISIYIENLSEQSQKVTLYIDKDPENAQMENQEKIISLQRNLLDNQKAQIQVQGYGPYASYSGMSPFIYSLGGSMVGNMLGNWLSNQQYKNYSTSTFQKSNLSNFKNNLNAGTQTKTQWNKNSGSWNKTKTPFTSTPNLTKRSWFGNKSLRSWGSSRRSFGRRR